ncbi:hypothetical protein L1049_007373 [Liquidambar formosana]|uniref:Uncharacterized protein n=1 Tax=Liquidambar formosana TaxID=63359 RepID=A0AAP0R1L5_LIQFO
MVGIGIRVEAVGKANAGAIVEKEKLEKNLIRDCDVVYIELLEVGAAVIQRSSFGVVESVKATSDIDSPISRKVVEVNEELNNSLGLVSHLMYIIACDTD